MNSTKIISWNVNGIRAIIKKDFLKNKESIRYNCLQETKQEEDEALEVWMDITFMLIFKEKDTQDSYSIKKNL